MHGNIWEWTNDWYGEYNLNDKINPQGLETGTHKVIAGVVFMIRHGDTDQLTAEVVLLRVIKVLATVSELIRTNKRL